MAVLVPCPSCARHVATSETRCPFCASALPIDLESRAIPGASRRLSRASMFTFATTVTALSIGTGVSTLSCAVYGAPCDPCFDESDGGVGYVPADASVVQDSSPDADATVVEDSGSPDDAALDDSGDAGEDAD
jgi:hypothetical protein